MKKRLSLALLAILLAPFAAAAVQSEWVRVAPVGGGFSFRMPANPKEESKTDADYSSHSFSLVTDPVIYIVEYGDYSPTIHLDVRGELNANRDNFVNGVNAKLIDSKEIDLDGHPGLEFTAENSQASMKSRVYLVGNRVFMIAVAVLDGKSEPENVERFLGSFAFAKP